MTYKSIVKNIVEREARKELSKALNTDALDFGTVEMKTKSKPFQDWAVDFKEIGKPWEIRVIGFIDESGYVTVVKYRYNNSGQWYDMKNNPLR